MRRREFITLLGGAVAWPVGARAQQPARMRRIGVLTTFGDSDALAQGWDAAFRKRLDESGWHDSRNVRIDHRWAAGNADRLQAFAKELVKEIAPAVRRVAMIYNPPTSPFAGYYLRP